MHTIDRVFSAVMLIALLSLAVYLFLPRAEPDGLDVFVRIVHFPFALTPESMRFGMSGDARIIEIAKWEPQILVKGRNLTLKGFVRPGSDGTLGGYSLAVGSTLPVVLDNITYDAMITEVRVSE